MSILPTCSASGVSQWAMVSPREPGEVVSFTSPSGGGYGNPFERDPLAVAQDVRRGLVSAEAARQFYGVVLVDGRVDDGATFATRASLTHERPRPLVTFGAERAAYEATWPDAARRAFRAILAAVPAALRPHVSQLLYRRIDADTAERRVVSEADVQNAWDSVRASMQLPQTAHPAG